MTRDEAHDNIPKIDNYQMWGIIHDTIDNIYDDFENRQCENCKSFINLWCRKLDLGLPKSFSCNRWEQKQ